jgi:predicted Zn finger-like uncharacterized protein
MKFSCPNCTAKYQIADDKVAGRTVKMKCRKCGTVIPIVAQPSKSTVARAPIVHAHSLKPTPGRGGPPTVPAQAPAAVWHAGIGGSAQGPMTEAQLGELVRGGSATRETFVWKEGMDGWKQLDQVPELASVLAGGATALGPPSMPAQAKLAKPAAPRPVIGSPVAEAPEPPGRLSPLPKPTAPPAPQAAPAIVPSSPLIRDVERALGAAQSPALSDLGSSPNASPSQVENKVEAAEAPIPEIALGGGEGPYVANQEPSPESLLYRLQKKRHNPYAIPLAVGGALILGITLGFVLFGDQKTKVVKQIVEVPAKVSEAAEHKREVKAEALAAAQADQQEEESGQEESANIAAKTTTKSAKTAATTEKAEPSKVSEGLKGLSGLEGLGGPTAGPSSSSSSSSSGRPLDSSQIQSTVTKYRTSVKRGCWQPALDSRDKDAPSSARVSVSITVAGNGSVTNASTSGDPRGYRGLASCISTKVRGWRFPVSSGTTTVNVPFVFAAQ